MLAYVPHDIRESTAGILVLGENGQTADDLLEHSGWCEIADTEECKERLIVFFLEPENGTWNMDEAYGTPDGDVAYINAAPLLPQTASCSACTNPSSIWSAVRRRRARQYGRRLTTRRSSQVWLRSAARQFPNGI